MLGLLDLQGQIREGNLLPFYIFTGEEIELQNIYLKQMGNVVRIDRVADIYNKITSKLIGGKFAVYVVRDDMDFIKSEKTWGSISNKIRNAVLVVQVTTPSKCKKFIKELNNCVVEFNHMTTKQLLNVVNMDCSVSNKQYFIEACNNDLNTINNYLDIFKRSGIKELNKKIVDEYIPTKEEVTVFQLADAIMKKDEQLTFRLLDQLLEDKNNAMGIIYAIYSQLHKCVLVEGYRGEEDIAKITGINSWICNNILRYNRIEPAKLLTALRLVQKYDQGVKTGKYEGVVACYSLIIEILSYC
jgi:DNA polymerase III delta subunit|nr:MAG TPA: DNA polymerase III, delta subunit [Caudoviricetes sp.]